MEKDCIVDIILSQIRSAWLPAEETWTRTSNTTFTTPGDKTDKYQKGDKIKLTQSGNVKYFYVIGVSYSSPNTTITVTGGSDYSLVSATIVDPYYSKAETPQGHPIWFNYVPTITSLTPSLLFAKFMIRGSTVFIGLRAEGTASGTPAYLGFTGPLPYPPTGTPADWAGGARVLDATAMGGYWQHQGSNVFRAYKYDTSLYTAGANRGILLQLFYEY